MNVKQLKIHLWIKGNIHSAYECSVIFLLAEPEFGFENVGGFDHVTASGEISN